MSWLKNLDIERRKYIDQVMIIIELLEKNSNFINKTTALMIARQLREAVKGIEKC